MEDFTLGRRVTQAFVDGFDLSSRPSAPPAGWRGLPEVSTSERLVDAGANPVRVRMSSRLHVRWIVLEMRMCCGAVLSDCSMPSLGRSIPSRWSVVLSPISRSASSVGGQSATQRGCCRVADDRRVVGDATVV